MKFFVKIIIKYGVTVFLLLLCDINYAASSVVADNGFAPTLSAMNGRISLDFQNINVRDLLHFIASFAQRNIIISEQITGKMSIKLRDVTWQEALATILKLRGLMQQEENSIIIIAPAGDMEKMNKNYLQAQKQFSSPQLDAPVLFSFKNSRAEDIAATIAKQNNLIANSSISVDKQHNTLLVSASASQQLAAIHGVANTLDTPTRQVIIEGQIVLADDKVTDELGLKFGTVASGKSKDDPKSGGVSMDLPLAALSPGHFGMTIAKLGAGVALNMELAALETLGHAKIISQPKLVVANNQPASIESGQEIPYQEKTEAGATSVAFKKAVLSLHATPTIISSDALILNLHLNQDKVSDITVNGVPAIETQQIKTQVTLHSGETVVLGGIYEYATIESVTKIPVLSAIPIFGQLFRNKHAEITRKELLILVTPQIING